MKEEARNWLELAESDYDASLYLFEGARYPQALYLLCQAVEKILKAAQIELANQPPKKTHQLKNLASITGLPSPRNRPKFYGRWIATINVCVTETLPKRHSIQRTRPRRYWRKERRFTYGYASG